jgi:hypothetical protein
MCSSGILTDLTDVRSKNYKGHDLYNMNQWFRVSKDGLKPVQSIQLEFGYAGLRDAKSIPKKAILPAFLTVFLLVLFWQLFLKL